MAEFSFLNPDKAVRAAKVHAGMHVADLGTGGGFFTRSAARAVGPSGLVWAVDANRDLLLRTKALGTAEGLHNIEIVAGNIEERGGSHLPDDEFDFVLAHNILFSARDKNTLAEEAWRILKRTGKALVIDWKDSFGGLGPHPSHIVTEAAARPLFESEGFTFVESVPCGAYHWGFVMRKK